MELECLVASLTQGHKICKKFFFMFLSHEWLYQYQLGLADYNLFETGVVLFDFYKTLNNGSYMLYSQVEESMRLLWSMATCS